MLFDFVVSCQHPAIAGAGRIEKNKIGEIEPGFGIIDGDRRRRWIGAIERQPPRAKTAEIEPGRTRAWAAIDGKG